MFLLTLHDYEIPDDLYFSLQYVSVEIIRIPKWNWLGVQDGLRSHLIQNHFGEFILLHGISDVIVQSDVLHEQTKLSGLVRLLLQPQIPEELIFVHNETHILDDPIDLLVLVDV